MTALDAILIVGPTGAGKTPLGDFLERVGWRGRKCLHFDFGANLRRAARGEAHADALTAAHLATVRRVLATGALLEDHEFPIAEAILRSFLVERGSGPGDWVVLNGLPRHAGQVRDLRPLVRIGLVVSLRCPADVIRRRIRLDKGGDRGERVDDSPEKVDHKLRIFANRTAPLLEYFRRSGVDVVEAPVECDTTPAEIMSRLI